MTLSDTAGDDRRKDAAERVETLLEALPYIRRFRDTVVVVKYGGHAMTQPHLARRFAEDVVLMHSVGIRPVVVHGGGPQIGALLTRLGIASEFREGLRVTDADTLDIARMVLVGKVNRDIVAEVNTHAPLAVGVSGEDAGLIGARQRRADLGFVGDVAEVNPRIIERLLDEQLIPIVSTIGSDAKEGQAYNINADTVAGAIATELGAEKIVYLTDVPGLLTDPTDPGSLVSEVTVPQLQLFVADGVVGDGMIPKVESAILAVEGGVGSAHLLDGRVPHVLLLEIFTAAGVGTMITRNTAGLAR